MSTWENTGAAASNRASVISPPRNEPRHIVGLRCGYGRQFYAVACLDADFLLSSGPLASQTDRPVQSGRFIGMSQIDPVRLVGAALLALACAPPAFAQADFSGH